MWIEGEMYEHSRARDLNKFIQYCDHGPRHCDDDVSHLRGATMRIPRTRTEQKIGPAWGEAAGAAGEHQQILRARITASSLVSIHRALDIQFTYSRLFLVQSLRQNVAGYILSAKESWDPQTKQNHFGVSYLYPIQKKQLLMVSSQCL